MVNHLFFIDRSDKSQALSDGEIGENAFFDSVGLLISDLVFSIEAIFEIGCWCYFSIVFVFELEHEISK